MSRVVLSHYQTATILAAREQNAAEVEMSLDLGMTTVQATIEPAGVRLPDRPLLPWEDIGRIDADPIGCFLWDDEGLRRIEAYSERSDRYYVLMATPGAPTLLNSGIPMHRIKDVDPQADTAQKMRAVGRIAGKVLDTATGLGYTAIAAAHKAQQVTTIEVDPVVLEVARLNPWSRLLFESPNIVQRIGDAFDVVQEFADGSFSRIIHDPPTFSMAGHLYSGAFYRRLHRVLRSGGVLFHYIGNLESKRGRNLARGVKQRLRDSGFSDVEDRRAAFGVVARK